MGKPMCKLCGTRGEAEGPSIVLFCLEPSIFSQKAESLPTPTDIVFPALVRGFCHTFSSLCYCLLGYCFFLGVLDIFLCRKFTHADSFKF